MSQYDFGTIDPFVVDGTTLAGMLNNWRDALYSLHRGSTRPDYAVPGMMWINDVGGPTNWVVNMYLGPSVGDRALFQVNTTTGAIAQVADQLTAALLSAQAAANPAFQWTAAGNAANARTWRALVLASGVLQFQSLSDAGAVQNAIDFNRDGTIRAVAPPDGDSSTLVPTTAWVKANASVGGVATPTYDASTLGQSSGTNYWPAGDVPFKITQGVQIFSRNFTAVDPTHPIEVSALISMFAPSSLGSHGVLGIFIDGTTDAAAMTQQSVAAGSWGHGKVYWQGVLSAGQHTFTLRLGSYSSAGMYTMMNDSAHQGGGSLRNTMTIREIGVGAVGPQGPPGPSGGPVTAPTLDTSNVAQTDSGGWTFGTVLQITQGTQVFSRSFTAVDAAHPIEVDCGLLFGAGGVAVSGVAALFIDGAPNAVAQQNVTVNAQWFQPTRLFWRGVLATGAHTFAVRFMGATGIYLLRNDASFSANNTYNFLRISEVGVGPVGPQGPAGSSNDVLQKSINNVPGGTFTGTYSTTTGAAPTAAGGALLTSVNLTPKSAASRVDFQIQVKGIAYSANQVVMLALFDGSTLIDCAAFWVANGPGIWDTLTFNTSYPSPGTTARTYNLRIGTNSGQAFGVNQVNNGSATPPQAGVQSWFNVFERAPAP